MAEFGTGLATNVAGTIIGKVIQKMKDIMDMEENIGDLNTHFIRLEVSLRHIEKQFQDQQRALPEPVQNCLGRMHTALEEAEDLIVRDNPRPRCLGCCSLRNPKLSTQIRDWKPRFDRLLEELERVFSTCANAHTESGFVGSTIKSDQMQLQTWLGEAHPEARMIGVYGIGGIGKTLLLKLVYNHYKEVSGTFDVIIWFTVSKEYQIKKLQASIAEILNLKLERIYDNDRRKMILSDSLENKKFLLILDDMGHPIDLIGEVGVKFGDHNCSKVLISSRSRDLIQLMGASEDYTLKIQPLSLEEGWELFRTRAFANGVVQDDIEATAREIASKCQGLPLTLNTVAAVMRGIKTADEWRRAFILMSSADPSFQASNRLKCRYDDIPNRELKICFLYCAVFPEHAEIPVETLVEMWSAEKLVTGMDVGYEYIGVLVDMGLFEYVAAGYETIEILPAEYRRVKVHDVFRNLAIYIGQSEESWFFATDQQRQNFPSEDEIRDCKRISVGHNDIQDLPTDLICSGLVSLVLANNGKITEVPERFLSTVMSLKVLDLSGTLITSLPTSLGELGQLEFLKLTGCSRLMNLPENIGDLSHLRFLNLEYCEKLYALLDSIGELINLEHLNLKSCHRLEVIPDSIGHLSHLRFLNLEYCEKLYALPDSIGELINLKHLNLKSCDSLKVIPRGIFRLTSLNKLFLPSRLGRQSAISMEDIANLSNLMELTELTAVVKSEIKERKWTTTWTDLRRLEVWCSYDADDVRLYIFPFDMQHLNKLEHCEMYNYEGPNLSCWISLLQNLRTLCLVRCPHILELPAVRGGFPMLKRLELHELDNLERMNLSHFASSEEIMPPRLEEICITDCSSLKTLGWKKLPRLKRLSISGCKKFEALEIESAGLPMLEDLQLLFLEKCQIIVRPSGVIDDGVTPKLKVLKVHYCGMLKRLGLEKLPNLRRISIWGCNELRELEIGSGAFPLLESLDLRDCKNLENLVGSPDAWNDKTMPKLELLVIRRCLLLRKLPKGIDKLSNLHQISGKLEWWQNLIWEDENVKNILFHLFKDYKK